MNAEAATATQEGSVTELVVDQAKAEATAQSPVETDEKMLQDETSGSENKKSDEGDSQSDVAEEEVWAREIAELKLVVAQLEKDKTGLQKELTEEKSLHEKARVDKESLRTTVQVLMQASKEKANEKEAGNGSAGVEQKGDSKVDTQETSKTATPQERMEATNAMRAAAMSGDVEALRTAIENADALGLTFEAQTARKRLAKLEKK